MRGKLLLLLGGMVLAGGAFAGGVFAERLFFSRPAVPLVPAEGGVVKNGIGPRDTALVWDFEWSQVPGPVRHLRPHRPPHG